MIVEVKVQGHGMKNAVDWLESAVGKTNCGTMAEKLAV